MSQSIFTCTTRGCRHREEWCNNNRNHCDALVWVGKFNSPMGSKGGRVARACGRLPTWLAPFEDPRFPLAYCGKHRPLDSYKRLGGHYDPDRSSSLGDYSDFEPIV